MISDPLLGGKRDHGECTHLFIRHRRKGSTYALRGMRGWVRFRVMASAANITNKQSFEAWLEAQPHAVAVQVVHRAAMRVLPRDWAEFRKPHHDIQALRCCLVSGVAGKRPSPEVANAAKDAAETNNAIFAAYSAVFAAKDVHDVSDLNAAPASVIVAAANVADVDSWEALQQDALAVEAGQQLDATPLWPGGANPLAEQWRKVRADWDARGPEWRFWIDWYEDALAGRPPDWAMLEEIALLPDEDWQKGAAHVNARIADIRTKYAIKNTPNAEVMSVNPETGRLRVDPISEMPPDHLADAVDKLRDAVALFDFDTDTGNQFRAIKSEWGIVKKAVDQYAARPRMLYSACQRVIKRLTTKVENGECPAPEKDADIGDFHGTVVEVATDLFERDPLVREAVTAKGFRHLPPSHGEDAQKLVNAADAVAGVSEGELAAELPAQARTAVDPDAPEDARKDAFYITASRLLRAYVIAGYVKTKRVLKEIESISKTTANIGKNAAITYGFIEVISQSERLQKAVQYIFTLL